MNSSNARLRAVPARDVGSEPSLRDEHESRLDEAIVRHPTAVAGLIDATNELLDRAADLVASALSLSQELADVLPVSRRNPAATQIHGHRLQVAGSAAAAPTGNLFRRQDGAWLLSYEGVTIRLRHIRGLSFIAQLLRRPQERILALDLLAGAYTGADHPANSPSLGSDVAPDYRAVAACRQRIADLRDILAEANAHHDWARAEQTRVRIEQLSDDLLQFVGFGRAFRRAGAAGERARINATRGIAIGIARISREHPTLGHYLARTIRTGTFCCYAPDPRALLRWE